MTENSSNKTGQSWPSSLARTVLVTPTFGLMVACGGGDGSGDTGTGPSEVDFTQDTSVQGVFNLVSLSVPAGVTITATGNLVRDVAGDITINGDLVGDCVEITISGQGSLTITGTISNECTVLPAAASATFSASVSPRGRGVHLPVTKDPTEVRMVPVPELWVEFSVENGVATGSQIRDGFSDKVIWEGTRVD